MCYLELELCSYYCSCHLIQGQLVFFVFLQFSFSFNKFSYLINIIAFHKFVRLLIDRPLKDY